MAIAVKKTFLGLYLACLFLLASNTIGFDIYFHAISVSELNLIPFYNPTWSISGYEIPRYILFQYLLWFSTLFGVLPLLPVLALLYAFLLALIIERSYNYKLLKYCLILFAAVNIVFTSALGLSVLLICLGLLETSNRLRGNILILLGSLIHPIGLLLGIVALVVLRRWKYLVALAVIVHTLHSLSIFSPSYSNHTIRLIELGDISSSQTFIYEKILSKLLSEVFYLLILLLGFAFVFYLNKVKQFKSVFAYLDAIPRRSSAGIFIALIVMSVSVYCFRAQVTTGGPLAILLFQGGRLSSETENIILGGWISPMILESKIKTNQYLFRGDL